MLQLLSILLLLATAWLIHYQHRVVAKPTLTYANTPYNQRLLARLPRLQRAFKPTPWAYNTHLQLLWLVLKDKFTPPLHYDRHETLTMSDGGTTSLAWLDSTSNPATPTLVVLHTIAGSPHSMRAFVRHLHHSTGWRVVVCTRRGHGLPFTAPRYNTMGHVSDLREQLAAIEQQFPQSPLYGIGVSAGSALLVRYLGEEKEASLLNAGVAYCPGYDIGVAFARVQPFYSRMMAKTMKEEFIAPYNKQFGPLPSATSALAATDLAELHTDLHEIAGFSSQAEYLSNTNPVTVMPNITVPLLALNADDDPVCVKENAIEHEHMVLTMPAALQVRTQRGSHCAFFTGWQPHSWAHDLISEYLQAVHAEHT